MSEAIGGRHRQRGTDRLMSYHCFFATRGDSVEYVGAISEDQHHHSTHEAALRFDSTLMSADEAVRQDICRHIDNTVFDEGREFQMPMFRGRVF